MTGREYRQKSTNGLLLESRPLTQKQKHNGAQVVAVNSTSVEDCTILLAMLGLTPQDGGADISRAMERGF